VRPAYRERRDALLKALARHFPRQAAWTRPVGGLFVWVTLPEGLDSADLLAHARTRGVVFNEGDLFGGGRRTLRLSYGGLGTGQIQAGVEILGRLAKERDTGGRIEEARRVEAVPIL
jgi:DNA-binding transcriptional MocR family regulator